MERWHKNFETVCAGTVVGKSCWNCGSSKTFGDGFWVFQPFRTFNMPDGTTKFLYGTHYGKKFYDYDEMKKFAYEHGYSQRYYRRTWCAKHRCLRSFMGKPSPTFDDNKCNSTEVWK